MFYLCFIFSSICVQLYSSSTVTPAFLKFSNQEGPPLNEATNYALLKSGALDTLPSDGFTICGSMYIAFLRGYQSFYTLRKNDHETLCWW